jgi:hypothetical protein
MIYNPYLTNYGRNAYIWTFFEIIRVSAISAVHQNYSKKNKIIKLLFFNSRKKKKKEKKEKKKKISKY